MVRAVVPPTVSTRRVRVCLHAGNTMKEVERLVTRIEEWLSQHVRMDIGQERTEVIKAQL